MYSVGFLNRMVLNSANNCYRIYIPYFQRT